MMLRNLVCDAFFASVSIEKVNYDQIFKEINFNKEIEVQGKNSIKNI